MFAKTSMSGGAPLSNMPLSDEKTSMSSSAIDPGTGIHLSSAYNYLISQGSQSGTQKNENLVKQLREIDVQTTPFTN
jgi:hypothetical protein